MQTFRNRRRKAPARELKITDLCNGPGKLTEALHITKADMNQVDLATDSSSWMERGEMKMEETDIVRCPRIGVDYATTECVKKPLRFYIRGNSCVSKRNKEAEDSWRRCSLANSFARQNYTDNQPVYSQFHSVFNIQLVTNQILQKQLFLLSKSFWCEQFFLLILTSTLQ